MSLKNVFSGDQAQLNQAAIRIQKAWQRHVFRKNAPKNPFEKFVLDSDAQTNFPAVFSGNDPDELDKLCGMKIGEPFVFVGTSCFFSFRLALACSDQGRSALIKKIIILDNSRNVIRFWSYLRCQIAQCFNYDSFERNLRNCQAEWCVLFPSDAGFQVSGSIPIRKDHEPLVYDTIQMMINRFYIYLREANEAVGFSELKRLIGSVWALPCDWVSKSEALFHAIRDWASKEKLKIALYTSNIASVLSDWDKPEFSDDLLLFFSRVKLLEPIVSIYSDTKMLLAHEILGMSPLTGAPSQLICMTGVGEKAVQQLISPRKIKSDFDSGMKVMPDIKKHFFNALVAFGENKYVAAVADFNDAINLYEQVASKGNLPDQYFLRYMLERLRGISMIKGGDEKGVVHLENSLHYFQSLYGSCEAERALKKEVTDLIADIKKAPSKSEQSLSLQ